MILLDTHIWVWWVHGDSRLSSSHAKLIEDHEDDEIGICTISLWEIAKLFELGRLVLPVALDEWFTDALAYPGVTLVDLTPGIAIESTHLPGSFHRDLADQIIVATARVFGCDLLTAEQRIRDYVHVNTHTAVLVGRLAARRLSKVWSVSLAASYDGTFTCKTVALSDATQPLFHLHGV